MAHEYKVIRSINLEFDPICVDIFLRPDGTYGFDEFRRDPEDASGWYSIGHHSHRTFEDYDAAINAAKTAVHWLASQL